VNRCTHRKTREVVYVDTAFDQQLLHDATGVEDFGG
jgi:hypothetical protein